MRFRTALAVVLAATLAWALSATPLAYAATPIPSIRPVENKAKQATSFTEVRSGVSDNKITITGKLVSKGKPVANVSLDLLVDGAKVGHTSTGADGSFHGEAPAPSSGDHQLTVVFAGNDAYLRSSAEGRVNVAVAAKIALSAGAESATAVAGATVTLTGTAQTKPHNQPIPNARIDINGGGQTTWAVTDDNGAFTVTISASTDPGPVTYSLTIGDVGGMKGTSTQVPVQITARPSPTSTPTPTPTPTKTPSRTPTSTPTASAATPTATAPAFVPTGPKITDLWPVALVAALALSSLLVIAAVAVIRRRITRAQDTATLSDITGGELDDLE